MSEAEKSTIPCPRCGMPMVAGHLKDPVNTIFIESMCSEESSSLEAWICPECGHVELQAARPENFAHHDIFKEDLGINRGGEKDWADWEEDL